MATECRASQAAVLVLRSADDTANKHNLGRSLKEKTFSDNKSSRGSTTDKCTDKINCKQLTRRSPLYDFIIIKTQIQNTYVIKNIRANLNLQKRFSPNVWYIHSYVKGFPAILD
uniref:Uncharacterized protein n=1 Tax=Romanomermis culicivorax TaxID=13658 RepID=A0A915IXI9_ROMCU